LVTFAQVVGTDWTVAIHEPVEDLIGPILRFPSIAPAVAAGAGVVSLLILTFGWLTIVRPLQRLARSAEQVSWGNYEAIQVSPRGVQEVRDLHQSIVEMVERIRGYQAGMRDYLGAVTQGQETERARLARELHDGPVQSLIALGHRAEMAQRSVGRDQAKQAQALLEELRQTARDTVQELRRLISALRPVYLEDLGFAPALQALIQEAAERAHVPIYLELGEDIKRLEPRVELAAYRIAQEALNNALQHAQPQHITVHLYCEAQTLVLTVSDDGIGFELPQQPDLLTRTGHFGLISMQERAMLLGGTLHIRTAPGQGTEVTARLPDRPVGP
jgi:signal transduction histidine kinase